ncbi:MAG: TetR family transcriptional regulator [Actinobacteria bacterium]|nr:TetR family transcriptional regulator [Actinomycetota bacterium]
MAQEVLAENERPLEHHLAALRLLDQATEVPTVLGILAIGYDPTAFIAGAYLQFVRYRGDDESAPIADDEELRGNLIGQLSTLERLLKANITTAVVDAGGLTQHDRPTYPLPALREVILNAYAHRNYESSNAPIGVRWFDDRVEVLSPGGPFGAVTATNYRQRNDYRNPSLAAALKHLGYVNRFGRGMALIEKLLVDNGKPPAEFEIDGQWWSVTLRQAS